MNKTITFAVTNKDYQQLGLTVRVSTDTDTDADAYHKVEGEAVYYVWWDSFWSAWKEMLVGKLVK